MKFVCSPIDRLGVGRCAEEWRPCPDHEGLYEVSSLGRIRSLHARFAEPRPCKFGTDQTGYPTVMLSKGGKRKPFTVHRLVALAFHGGQRNALHREVAHLDGDMKNARADNLKWVSKTENESHKYAHGTKSPERYGKLSGLQVAYIRSQIGSKSHAAIARELGIVKAGAVGKIARGERWKNAGAAIAGPSQAFVSLTRNPSLEPPARFEPTIKAEGDIIL